MKYADASIMPQDKTFLHIDTAGMTVLDELSKSILIAYRCMNLFVLILMRFVFTFVFNLIIRFSVMKFERQ